MRGWPSNISGITPLLADTDTSWNASALQSRIGSIQAALESRVFPRAPVVILADNSPDWIAIDLATQAMNIPLIPLPTFFTPAQWKHAIETSGAQAIFCSEAQYAHALGFRAKISCDSRLHLYEGPQQSHPDTRGTQKITFTSGTTGEPKGVCLSSDEQWQVAHAIHAGIAHLGLKRHLCLLPMSVLLENVAGVYTAMLCGATTFCPPLSETGMIGASSFDPVLCLDAIQRYQAESVILLPQMLQALTAIAEKRDVRIKSLKFVAVGGARTPSSLLHAAREKGFPVYEGYGLTECCSVVALNLPGQDRIGSVGKPLANRQVRIAADGELEVLITGDVHYLGQPEPAQRWLPTGDIGHMDADGYLYIDGRKKNVLVTGYGRNVSPEWPESLLLGTGVVAQAIVLGDAQPYLAALIVPASKHHDRACIQQAVDQCNQALPDYARIGRWIKVEPFSLANGLATANGRLKRAAILQRYQEQINSLYENVGA
ncbi:AMP-binding protein [Oxalobacteraceae bacterium R-40]|uniref:AMP-binding protein n=1 Tax=Keguizhuia sedimenti TaxID=3064264 RepID=A0ABU1BQM3_9BURK|nr:AMP-binding protein [Oxalobacteraceae bacterium R-40]